MSVKVNIIPTLQPTLQAKKIAPVSQSVNIECVITKDYKYFDITAEKQQWSEYYRPN